MAGLVGQDGAGLPVGQWFQDATFWVATELDGPIGKITSIVEWTVERVVEAPVDGTDITTISWLWVAGAAFLIGLLTKRPLNGFKATFALSLCASVGGLHFCGDYVWCANTDGAVKTANIAARRVLDQR